MTLLECTINKPLMIVGYTTREHLLLDLDHTSHIKAYNLAVMIIHNYPRVGNCLMVTSSIQEKAYGTRITKRGVPQHNFRRECLHLIFDNVIGYDECCMIINTLVDLDVLETAYRRIRTFRGDMTIRISPMVLSDFVKEQPMPWIYIHNMHNKIHDRKVVDYLKLWEGCSRLFLTYPDTKDKTYNACYPTYYTCC